ncbi:MAG: nickel-dependent hydrogenase large subunit [Melioribacteraceae bacterium]|nr:nickel-dependent hydrogenase large subunit [Melioribacteraceae bacterium]MCF8265456.1 nickel-dependent hydrogenase large subunit [Melioribacteraceae bacterium]
MAKIVIDPLNRVEGHLKIEAVVENGVVTEARSAGTLWRGIENILEGRNPLDAQRITQRICGVCPTAHSTASTLNLDSAFGIAGKIPDNGRIMRNLIFGSNYLQSHILHFYHLTALDYVDVAAVADYKGKDPELVQVKQFIDRGSLAPFFPRYEGDYRLKKEENVAAVKHYVQALKMRTITHELLGIFGGKMPHNMAMVPGGCSERPTVDKIADFRWRLEKVRSFINDVYIPDVLMVASRYPDYFSIGSGVGKYMSYGGFELDSNPDLTKRKRLFPRGRVSIKDLKLLDFDPEQITEDIKYSWYKSGSGLKPAVGETVADRKKSGAYSWLKAPRYNGEVHEVGPVGRQLIAYLNGFEPTVKLVDYVLGYFKAPPSVLDSTLGRHAARAIEAKIISDYMAEWVLELKPGEPVHTPFEIPESAEGMGITEAPRGSLGHWITIKDHKISNYQAVVPTTWNGGPRDDKGQPGPFEQALEGTKVKDPNNPFELVRIVRAFDPCLACAIHVVTPKGKELSKFIIEA